MKHYKQILEAVPEMHGSAFKALKGEAMTKETKELDMHGKEDSCKHNNWSPEKSSTVHEHEITVQVCNEPGCLNTRITTEEKKDE